MRISRLDVMDVRFPTSRGRHGSDAMNPDPDYSATYVVAVTDDGELGFGLSFTIGRGNEVVCAAARALAPAVVGLRIGSAADMGDVARHLARDSQLRWIGPEKGAIHLATAAILNAVWDLVAKRAEMPMWELLCRMEPAAVVDLVDFRYISDELSPTAALDLLTDRRDGLAERMEHVRAEGLAAYTTSAGWLGYDDDTIRSKTLQAVDDGFGAVKLKVGVDPGADAARLTLVRSLIGDDIQLMVDANQVWDVPEAIAAIRELAPFELTWVEEPTSPDDVLGHATIAEAVAPIPIATGEMAQNRILVKQLLQSGAIDICQPDSCRLGSINEFIAVLLMCAQRDVPVCPHAGGVGLNEYVVHLAAFDQIAVAGTSDRRIVEYVDNCSEHLVEPALVVGGRYRLPEKPGYGSQLRVDSVVEYGFPNGPAWRPER